MNNTDQQKKMKIKEFMREKDELISCSPNTTVKTLVLFFSKKHISAILVKEFNQIIGIVTKTDMLIPILKSDAYRAKDIMSTRLSVIDQEAELDEASNKMSEEKIHHLLVQDQKKIVGLISSMDVIRNALYLSSETKLFAQIATGEKKLGPQWEAIPQDEDYDLYSENPKSKL